MREEAIAAAVFTCQVGLVPSTPYYVLEAANVER